MQNASRQGALAAAYVAYNAVKRSLAGGYTSGLFVTGHVLNSVTVGDPEPTGDGGWQVSVGTNVLYALFWELGHMNTFTRRYERVEKWRPAAIDSRAQAIEAFYRVYKRVMEGGV
jgi:hypothetical protein